MRPYKINNFEIDLDKICAVSEPSTDCNRYSTNKETGKTTYYGHFSIFCGTEISIGDELNEIHEIHKELINAWRQNEHTTR